MFIHVELKFVRELPLVMWVSCTHIKPFDLLVWVTSVQLDPKMETNGTRSKAVVGNCSALPNDEALCHFYSRRMIHGIDLKCIIGFGNAER